MTAGDQAKQKTPISFDTKLSDLVSNPPVSTPLPAAKRFHCPICGTGSVNRQGVFSHLRQIHKLEKPARDSAMAAAGRDT